MHLENCPHFGGRAEIKISRKPFLHGWVGCLKCHCYINRYQSDKTAVENWNRRKLSAESDTANGTPLCTEARP